MPDIHSWKCATTIGEDPGNLAKNWEREGGGGEIGRKRKTEKDTERDQQSVIKLLRQSYW